MQLNGPLRSIGPWAREPVGEAGLGCSGLGWAGGGWQRVALQIAFWVGPGQHPEYLEWLLSELMK